ADPGPGLLAGVGEPAYGSAEDVETLRNTNDGFDLEVSILHPGGVSELYLGQVKSARIDLATDAVMRSASAKEHTASTRMYGLVDEHLLWAWDLAALGRPLTSHASGRLARVD
ncbi:MAG: FABP family protein, partial [Salinibacterium sp.]|nr:FABP family protein [Salinibacterium sp.]